MASNTPPYMNAYGNIEKALNKIVEAQTPPRFTQDFLSTTLGMKGGSATPIIPFLKRLGFLGGDGVPTDIYKRFRNEPQRGAAAAEALREGYKKLYEINEFVHDASDQDLLGVVIQATGLEAKAPTAKAIVASFKAVRKFADFNADGTSDQGTSDKSDSDVLEESVLSDGVANRLGLSYTINLNLPATSDIKVFDAIFKSLRENLLK